MLAIILEPQINVVKTTSRAENRCFFSEKNFLSPYFSVRIKQRKTKLFEVLIIPETSEGGEESSSKFSLGLEKKVVYFRT